MRYDNRTGRPPGRVVRVGSAVLPGVARVWRQVDPYADAWHAHNLATLSDTSRSGRRWVVLGDSMSQGVGASSYDAGWVGQLARRLAATGDGLQVLNLSATGARTDDVLQQQLPALAEVGSRPDDLVTVMVGSNDLFGGRGRRERLPAAFAELVDAVPTGTVVATLPQPTGVAGQANTHVERAAAAGRVVMLDLRVSGPDSWKGRLAADWFHPNDAGYAAIADAVEPTVRAVLAGSA
ncbi:SGNH/GDSL hydrolase family protein [Nocardioides rubriscoriae]|uniref:SGNH/GDSL hydrolase family protein n=1 Tax=Nocardioides rubriscoriae TaxID=642762 RepID=UPI0011DFE07B|nr:SGNH/GDSL hydrolase family protein [Nocardioides rubriscoriae]